MNKSKYSVLIRRFRFCIGIFSIAFVVLLISLMGVRVYHHFSDTEDHSEDLSNAEMNEEGKMVEPATAAIDWDNDEDWTSADRDFYYWFPKHSEQFKASVDTVFQVLDLYDVNRPEIYMNEYALKMDVMKELSEEILKQPEPSNPGMKEVYDLYVQTANEMIKATRYLPYAYVMQFESEGDRKPAIQTGQTAFEDMVHNYKATVDTWYANTAK